MFTPTSCWVIFWCAVVSGGNPAQLADNCYPCLDFPWACYLILSGNGLTQPHQPASDYCSWQRNAGGSRMEKQCGRIIHPPHCKGLHTSFCPTAGGKVRGCSSPGNNHWLTSLTSILQIVFSIHSSFNTFPWIPFCRQAYWHNVGVNFYGGTAMLGNSKSSWMPFHIQYIL